MWKILRFMFWLRMLLVPFHWPVLLLSIIDGSLLYYRWKRSNEHYTVKDHHKILQLLKKKLAEPWEAKFMCEGGNNRILATVPLPFLLADASLTLICCWNNPILRNKQKSLTFCNRRSHVLFLLWFWLNFCFISWASSTYWTASTWTQTLIAVLRGSWCAV